MAAVRALIGWYRFLIFDFHPGFRSFIWVNIVKGAGKRKKNQNKTKINTHKKRKNKRRFTYHIYFSSEDLTYSILQVDQNGDMLLLGLKLIAWEHRLKYVKNSPKLIHYFQPTKSITSATNPASTKSMTKKLISIKALVVYALTLQRKVVNTSKPKTCTAISPFRILVFTKRSYDLLSRRFIE